MLEALTAICTACLMMFLNEKDVRNAFLSQIKNVKIFFSHLCYRYGVIQAMVVNCSGKTAVAQLNGASLRIS